MMEKNKNEVRLNSLYSLGILDTDPDERFDRLTRLAVKIFNVPIAFVSLVDEDRQWFKSICGTDLKSTTISDSFCALAVKHENYIVINDTLKDIRFMNNRLVTHDPCIRFYAGFPVRLPDGQIAGTICIIDTKPREFSYTDLAFLKDLAGIVEDEFKIISIATKDSLTGICNRRSFRLILDVVFKNHQRNNKKFSVIIIDLNKFKPINDFYGHAEGNIALCAFSSILENLCDENNFVARLGGDEFGVILSDASRLAANGFINELSAELQVYNMKSGKPYSISFAAGSVEYNSLKHMNSADIIRDADEEMYYRKNSIA